MDRKNEDASLIVDTFKRRAAQISALMPEIPSMHLKPDDIELILEVLKQHVERISTSKTLLKKVNVRLSYFFSYNPGVEVFMKTPDLEGDIDVYFGSGTADISVFNLNPSDSDALELYGWHNTIKDVPQFLDVLRDAFDILFSDISQGREEDLED